MVEDELNFSDSDDDMDKSNQDEDDNSSPSSDSESDSDAESDKGAMDVEDEDEQEISDYLKHLRELKERHDVHYLQLRRGEGGTSVSDYSELEAVARAVNAQLSAPVFMVRVKVRSNSQSRIGTC